MYTICPTDHTWPNPLAHFKVVCATKWSEWSGCVQCLPLGFPQGSLRNARMLRVRLGRVCCKEWEPQSDATHPPSKTAVRFNVIYHNWSRKVSQTQAGAMRMSPALSIIYSEVDVAMKQHPDSSFFRGHKPLLTPFLDPCPACLRISSLQRYPTITRTTMNLPAETSQPIWSQSFASAGHRHSRARRSGCIINSFILYHIYPPNIYACCTMSCIYIYEIF